MIDQQKDKKDLQKTLKRMLELSEDYEYVSILRSVIGLGWEEYNKQIQEEVKNEVFRNYGGNKEDKDG